MPAHAVAASMRVNLADCSRFYNGIGENLRLISTNGTKNPPLLQAAGLFCAVKGVCLFVLFFERLAQNVAKTRAGIGRTILLDGLLLFGELQRLD